jgi:hypothetical protein
MNPDSPQTPITPPSGVDYLNQIAPKQQKKLSFARGPRLLILIGAILVLVVIAAAIVLNIISQSTRYPLEQMTARLNATQEIVTSAKSNLKNSELRGLNSNLGLYLTNTNRDIAEPLLSAGVNVDKLDEKVVSDESSEPILSRLEDARLNAIYDRTYAREMAYQLETLIALMKQIYSSTGNSELKEFLQTTYASLEPTQKAFAEFNAANG